MFRIRRGGSRGFVLTEDSMDDDFYIDSLIQEKEWLDKFRKKLDGSVIFLLLQFWTSNNTKTISMFFSITASPLKQETNASSKYSFSTSEYSSDLEELYDQFAKYESICIINHPKKCFAN